MRGDVHRYRQGFSCARLELRAECQGLVKDVPTQNIKQLGALDERKKLRRRQNPQARMLPAYQCFNTHQLAVKADLGLIVRHPLLLAGGQLCRCQAEQLRVLRRSGSRQLTMVLLQVAAQQLMQDQAGGGLFDTAQHVQAQIAGQRAHAVDHTGLGPAEDHQRCRQLMLGQVPNQCQSVRTVHLQVANGDIDPAASRQGLTGSLNRVGGQYIKHAIGVEHLMQRHQLKGMVLENQNLE
ncbi:hypothetical protein D9M71_244190 [compost metagenome]